jgi:hypothetical protein
MPSGRMISSATRRASGLLAPVRSVYRTSGVRGVAGMAKKPAMIGGGLFAGSGVIANRRRSGLDRTTGRPTGMYNY